MSRLGKKDLVHDNLVNILGGHGIGINIHAFIFYSKPRSSHLCTKISSKNLSKMVQISVWAYKLLSTTLCSTENTLAKSKTKFLTNFIQK